MSDNPSDFAKTMLVSIARIILRDLALGRSDACRYLSFDEKAAIHVGIDAMTAITDASRLVFSAESLAHARQRLPKEIEARLTEDELAAVMRLGAESMAAQFNAGRRSDARWQKPMSRHGRHKAMVNQIRSQRRYRDD
jgi:hypothetical protein